ncbi:MAG: hypothetical protein JST05_00575 [Acidobacteria bacterium]|nr:hypothetical protein [Acidobacteriota bacterium]
MRPLMLALLTVPVAAQVTTAPTLQARFLSRADASRVLAADDYFSLLHVPELRAKTGLPLTGMDTPQARAAAKAYYAESAQDFTEGEKAAIQTLLAAVAPEVTAKLPLMARTPFTFIKSGVEGGLPHTRGACIVLSPRLLAFFAQAAQRNPTAFGRAAGGLLVHEQTHVLERQHPDLFAKLFTEVFGFRRLPSAPDAPSLAEVRVVNPDGPDLAWAFPVPVGKATRWIRPDLRLGELEHPKMPQDFQEIAVDLIEKDGTFALDLDAKGAPKVEPLDAITAYRAAFTGVDEAFHPNEIAAVLISGWITGDPKTATLSLRQRTADWAAAALR